MANRLASSTSPYLLQHADNPVDWHLWGQEAFEEARRRDIPVLLSVGYSACHWCHVMAHESFEDPATAAVMNHLFVNVKVDREERPDVDSLYMEAVQAMTGHGGWPMTVWLTPDGRPFHAGTYFPKAEGHGLPSFRRVMEAVAEAWRERRSDVDGQAAQVTAVLGRRLPASPSLPSRETLEHAYQAIEKGYDSAYGGFGAAPKFPQQPLLEYLLRIAGEPWAPRAAEMLRYTLERMAAGGIYDQLGGGFARYSVDATWLVPHFEKMLYDNAQLARLYLRAWQELGVPRFRTVAVETLEYLLRDLALQEGGFASAEDADSEGVEGKFYVWDHEEFLKTVGEEDGPVAAFALGVTPTGNFEGHSILHLARPPAAVGQRYGLTEEEVGTVLARARPRLFEARAKRVRPGRDFKAVAAWNGLALRALAEAGAILSQNRYITAGEAAASFLVDRMRRSDGRLLRSWSRGRADIPGFLDDYGAVAMGLFALYQATGNPSWFAEAERVTRAIPVLFADGQGLAATGADAEALVTRPHDLFDNPSPSGNSLAAEALLTLSLYTGEEALRTAAESALRAGGRLMEEYPSGLGYLLSVFYSLLRGPLEVAVVGPDLAPFTAVVWERFRPHVALAVDAGGNGGGTVPLLAGRGHRGETLAYVCRDFVCEAPTSDPAVLSNQLA